MDREKVLELVREAELDRQLSMEVPFVVDRLERFAALVEAEVRGDAESVASVHIKDGCLIGSQRKSGVDIPDGQYALYPIGTFPAPAVDAEPVKQEPIKFLANSTRFKLSFQDTEPDSVGNAGTYVTCFEGWEHELDGRWVALVDAEDGRHLAYTNPAPAVDAEPVGYTNEGYRGMQYANAEAYKDIRPDFIQRNKLTAPLYKHPTPAVVRGLVEALSRMTSVFLDTEGSYGSYETDAIEFAEQALAAAKEAGI